MTARAEEAATRAKVVKALAGKAQTPPGPTCPACHSHDVKVRRYSWLAHNLNDYAWDRLVCKSCGYREEATL